jgi:hypothetical protein
MCCCTTKTTIHIQSKIALYKKMLNYQAMVSIRTTSRLLMEASGVWWMA